MRSSDPPNNLRWRPSLPALGLQGQVYFFAFVLLALILLVTVIVTWVFTNSYGFRQAENQIDQGLISFDRQLQSDTNDLDAIGKWIVNNAKLARLVRDRDQRGVIRELEPLGKTSLVDLVIVSDSSGNVLDQFTTGALPSTQIKFMSVPGVTEALAGHESSRLDKDTNGDLFQKSVLPIYDGSNTQPVGVLTLGLRIDARYLNTAGNRKGIEYVLISGNRFAKTTLTDRLGQPWEGNFATVALEPLDEMFAKNLSVVFTDQGPFLFKFRPLDRVGDADIKLLGAGIPMSALNGERNLLRNVALLTLAGGLAIFLVSGFLSGQSLIKPVHWLTAAVQRMEQGDLTTKVGLKRGDQIGDLGKALEKLRKNQAQRLENLTRDLKWNRSTIDVMSASIVLTNAKHQIAGANASALALLRTNGDNILGQPWHSFFAMCDSRDEMMPLRHPRSNNDDEQRVIVRGRFPLRTQPDIILDITSTQVDVDNMPEGYVHVLHDVSEVEHFSRAKDQFILNVAHELQGPLASWRSSLEILIQDYPNLTSRELGVMLKGLERGAIKFEGLIEVLIDIGKLEAGRFKIRPVPTRIVKLVQDGVGTLEALLKTKGQTLQVRADCPATCMVLVDRPRITQVLTNLIKNASKYGPDEKPIEVSIYREAGFVFVEVTDHGDGIPPEEQAHLFERFFRGKNVEEEGGGIGIGLALCKGIIDAHNGHIGVRSQIGEGATFWFSFPELFQNPGKSP